MEITTTNYKKVFSELYEIFKYLPDDFKKKIPVDFFKIIKDNRNKDYLFKYDKSKKLEEQAIYEETKAFITYLYMNYYCSLEEKEKLIKKMKENTIKREEELRKKYNPDKIFENKEKKELSENVDNESDNSNIILKKENIFRHIILKIKSLFF